MRAIALIATYNERRFIAPCIEHLVGQGVDVYLIDNESTDDTVQRAEPYLGHGLLAIETLPRADIFSLSSILRRKEQLSADLEADWFIVQDADEFRTAPTTGHTLVEALHHVDCAGFNAVEFTEFSFMPTIEAPDHDHPLFQETLLSYYAFIPRQQHRITAFKKQPMPVDLVVDAGHRATFDGRRVWPEPFQQRHYLCLSRAHAGEKYLGRVRTAVESGRGWGGWRNTVAAYTEPAAVDLLELPTARQLRSYNPDDRLDDPEPRGSHLWMETWAARIRERMSAPSPDQLGA
jgi:hypothetical protein